MARQEVQALTKQEKSMLGDTVRYVVKSSAEAMTRVGLDPQLYRRAAFNAFSNDPLIARQDQDSLRAALLKCVERGLMPDGDQAALVPFKGKVQLIVMYRGMLDRLRAWNPNVSVQCEIVYDGEDFTLRMGSDFRLEHIPSPGIERTVETVMGAWATVHYPGQVIPEYEWMWADQIWAVRDREGPKNYGPWVKDWQRMVKKTVLRPLLQRQPIRGIIAGDWDDEWEDTDDPHVQKRTSHRRPSGTVIPVQSEPVDAPPAPAKIEAPKQAAPKKPVARKAAPRKGGSQAQAAAAAGAAAGTGGSGPP